MQSKVIKTRPAEIADAETLAKIHFAAVHRGTASEFYPSEILFNWSPEPNEKRIERFRGAIELGKELFIIGEIDGSPGGFGCVLPELCELRSLYVDPAFTRKGIGLAILRQLEDIAAGRGVRQLHLNSSLNAEPFYLAQGYELVERSLHQLSGGMVMACVKMTKKLSAAAE